MTSTVAAELRDDVGFEQIFRALFPSGSITGAPKVRAMQLIAGLEGTPRGVYTGAIGFFSPQRTVFNVAIRTLELHNDLNAGHNAARGIMGAGSGVVIDSDAAGEYRECLLKAEFLTRTQENFPQEFSLIETMLWKGAYPFIDLHLDRLIDSADYFDIACDREAIRAALETYAQALTVETARRVRLLLNRSGSLTITDEALAASDPDRVGRIRLSQTRTDPADPMLFHKTTHRPIYAGASKAASQDGYDDILFLNLRGELTEGAISNVFIEKNGRWSTPSIECGVLAGVFRRHLLESRTEIEEKILYLDDILQADAIYLANALRGLRRVHLEPCKE
jgi:para-aminobenzoate synthetase/4-amino-4-deoxychorismate lyase